MNTIVTICSDSIINQGIERVIQNEFPGDYNLRFTDNITDALDILNFELPELTILHLSDKELDLTFLKDKIVEDSWLHSSGIIGIYDLGRHEEARLLDQFRSLNLLTLLDYSRIRTHFAKILSIVYANRQLIYQNELADNILDKFSGAFSISNSDYSVVSVYTGLLSINMVRSGRVTSEERFKLQMALSELILNGIEHGNCGITKEMRDQKLSEGGSLIELIQEKNLGKDIRRKKVLLEWILTEKESRFVIHDEGEGFDVEAYKRSLQNASSDNLSSRGILLSRIVADRILFNKKGNQVTMVMNHRHLHERLTPAGFSSEEMLIVKEGDIVVRSGDPGDSIFYISSGSYKVVHHGQIVGRITPEDVFLGEMAFLLNKDRSASVIAETSGKLIRIPRKSFIKVLKQYPQYGLFLSRLLASRLKRTNEFIVTSLGDEDEDESKKDLTI
ncbi:MULTISPECIES: cyclic nucleotide-binding domain-containing protein [unclassified Oceanispirochaeta]|uniref:cyclic nucleotide-binding domain-containing protein n=1 Tax=unclassified Oceanispirochaeta TaxID=2635722 RepID=UPI000E09B308|nr:MULTISPECIES: cyclic nucleotide-binding domain-containing protein [unclassified Oceanispirochaeta]MBF9015364.1 cyclic nucleotide-binding domain-containing protein [Oceanispirochaeta sp. M2]NPD71822.1 cyclic nucleotide-binding domain-containing protein [Oceanispirochaeta sp. M1]RDG33011.1 cyclic nucleotide-binding protein [Oceanispirochaeta sp. M1]